MKQRYKNVYKQYLFICFVSVWFQALDKPGCKTDTCTHRLERRKTLEGLSDSNPNTQKEGGGKVCPIVTPAERNEREQKWRGMVREASIFI